jgi:diadenosine tetraphosphate (Ap4A) HIT family hydrolase
MDCIFCKIASGEWKPMGNGTIYETDQYMAWLSPFPNTPGFTVVIPKKHYDSDVLQMPDSDLQEFILEAKKISQLLLNYFPDVGRVGLIMEGTGIDHAHIKLYPMHGTEYMKQGERKIIPSDYHEYFVSYPGYMASNDGPQADFEELEKLAVAIKNYNSL